MNITPGKIFDPENEEDNFVDEFWWVINDEHLPKQDNIKICIDGYSKNKNDVQEPGPVDLEDDPYLNMNIGVWYGGEDDMLDAWVRKRIQAKDGNLIDRANDNLLLDTRMYEVEYYNGFTETIAANILAENILAQVDDNGY